jgi:large subunit ribosomal protein L15
MQTHLLKLKNKKKRRKIVGRGGKKGTTSGKGSKGQKARSGAHVDPLFEGGRSTLIDHMKKKRGFKSNRPVKTIVKMENLEKKFKDGEEITVESLVKANLIKKSQNSGIKILGKGNLKSKFIAGKNVFFSATAKKSFKNQEEKNKKTFPK